MFSNSCQNAIRAVIYLSIHASEEKKLGIEEISEALDVSRHFLAKTLQNLGKNGFVSSTRGPNGGFYLDDENQNLNLLSLITHVDGPRASQGCVLGLAQCSSENPCPFHEHVNEFRNNLDHALLKQSIAEAAKQIGEKNLRF